MTLCGTLSGFSLLAIAVVFLLSLLGSILSGRRIYKGKNGKTRPIFLALVSSVLTNLFDFFIIFQTYPELCRAVPVRYSVMFALPRVVLASAGVWLVWVYIRDVDGDPPEVRRRIKIDTGKYPTFKK